MMRFRVDFNGIPMTVVSKDAVQGTFGWKLSLSGQQAKVSGKDVPGRTSSK